MEYLRLYEDQSAKYRGIITLDLGQEISLDASGKFISISSIFRHGSTKYTTDYDINPFETTWHYVPEQSGYDAIDEFRGLTHNITGVIIRNSDGSLPESNAPVAHDDYVSFGGGWDGTIKASQILTNDDGGSFDFAVNVAVTDISDGSALYSDTYYDFTDVFISSDYHGPIGSLSFDYRVMNAVGDYSNKASVLVEWFDGQTDRKHLVGTANADKLDFNASTAAVGLFGLGGDDTIRGSQAGDNLNGDDGADRIGGKGGNDIINGGNGNDTIFGDAGNDTIDGGADNDTLWGGDGNDIIRGGLGNDQVYGEAGDDQVGGKAGNDAVHGGAGNDTIWGDEGNDALYGDAGNDNLNGGAGNDFLTGGLGIDRMRGEAGVDTFVFMRGQAQGDIILDFEGAGIVGGDKIEFRGYGAGATVHQVSGDTWQIDAAGISETFKIAGVSNLSKVDFYFT